MSTSADAEPVERGRPVERDRRVGPPVDEESVVAVDDAEPPDVQSTPIVVGGVAEGEGLAHGLQLVDPPMGVHGPVGRLTDQRGGDGRVGLSVLVVEVANPVLGGGRRFPCQDLGRLSRSFEMLSVNGADLA